MPLLPNINDLEKDKFALNSSNETAVRTISEIVGAVVGSFSPSGLKTRLKITNQNISAVAAPIPSTALINRNSLTIFNESFSDTIFIGESDVTTSGATRGWQIAPRQTYSIDVTDAVTVYAICEIGKTISVQIKELS